MLMGNQRVEISLHADFYLKGWNRRNIELRCSIWELLKG